MAETRPAHAAQYTTRVSATIRTPTVHVFRALTEDTARWWPRSFCVGPATGFVFEATPGGRVCERWGDSDGLLWFHVTGIQRPTLLQLSGDLWPGFGGPARSYTTIRLEGEGDETLLELVDTSWGFLTADAAASIERGWTYLIADCLAAWCERRLLPEAAVQP